jgi:hypothetical protein
MKKFIGITAIALSGIGIYLFNRLGAHNLVWEKLQGSALEKLLFSQVSVLSILVFIVLLVFFYLLLKPFTRMETFYSKKQRKLKKMNSSNDQKSGILYRWAVNFEWTGRPILSDLEIFCTRHGNTPQKFTENRCPIPDCINHNQAVNVKFIHNHWESHLVDQWEKIN